MVTHAYIYLAGLGRNGRTRRDERGANLVEYALLVALIAIVCAAAVASLGDSLPGEFSSATEGLNGNAAG